MVREDEVGKRSSFSKYQGTTPSSSSILCSLILSSFNICYVPFLLIDFIPATFTLGSKHKKIIPKYPFSRGPSL